MALPNGRRADILALRPDGGFVCIEVKSGPRDFLVDAKWPEYRDFADALFFAVDADFPQALLPAGVGLIVTAGLERLTPSGRTLTNQLLELGLPPNQRRQRHQRCQRGRAAPRATRC